MKNKIIVLSILILAAFAISRFGSGNKTSLSAEPKIVVEPKPLSRAEIPPQTQTLESFKVRQKSDIEEKLMNFRKLDSTVLRSASQESDYRQLLSDPKTLRDVYLFLTVPDEHQQIQSRIDDSIVAVDFLTSALRWNQNPERADVIQKISNYLVSESYQKINDEKFLAALAGDQAELYMLLVEQSPETARDLRDHSRGTRLAKIIQFSEDIYLRSNHDKSHI